MARLQRFLQKTDTSDFSAGDRGADDFAEAVVDEIKTAYKGSFTSARAETIVRRTTKDIYTFYRLKDTSPFGDAVKPRLKFGGADTRSIRFFDSLDNFYFSGFLDNTRADQIRTAIRAEYLEKGAALFGRETGETIADFREATGTLLDKINDVGVKTIITSSVQRIRNYAHILSLGQGQYEFARIIAIIDARTSPICHFLDGKYIRLGVAIKTVERLTKLEPGDYALELYKSELGKAYASDSVNYVKDRIGGDDVIADSLVAEGRGFPPYHPNCRTRAEAVIPGTGGPKAGSEQ